MGPSLLTHVLTVVIVFIILIEVSNSISYPIYSIDGEGNNTTITQHLSVILKDQLDSLPIKTYFLGDLYQMDLYSEHMIRDIQNNISFDVPSFNGDVGSDFPRVVMITKNNFSIDSNNILVDTNVPYSLIQSNHKNAYEDGCNRNNGIKANCSSHITDIDYIIEEIKSPPNADLKHLSKIERIGNYSFGIASSTHKVFNLAYTNSSIQLTNIHTYELITTHLKSMTVVNFWTAPLSKPNPQIVFLDSNNKAFVYNVIFDNDTIKSLTLFKDFALPSLITQIRKMAVYGTHLYYCQDTKGVYQLKLSDGTAILMINQSKFNGPILDFVIKEGFNPNQTVFFAVIKDWGLYVHDITSGNSHSLMHPNLKQIDYFINALYGTVFLGILVEQTQDNEEFFIEFLFSYPTSKVKVNKILTGIKKSIIPFYTPDLFYTYLYDTIKRKLFIIRRGLINKINFVSYAIDLSSYEALDHISSIYNPSIQSEMIMLFSNSNNVHLFRVLNYSKYSLECYFIDEGEYLLKLIQNTEGCLNSINNVTTFSITKACQKITLYGFTILGDAKSVLRIETEGYLWLCFIFIGFVLLLSLSLSTNCFKVNVFRLVNDKNKDIKEYCYEEQYIPKVSRTVIHNPDFSSQAVMLNSNDSVSTSKFNQGFLRHKHHDRSSEFDSITSKSSSRTIKKTLRDTRSEADIPVIMIKKNNR